MNVGDKIPAILGTDQNGKLIKAEDFRGKKLVLYTYPKDSTSGCTAEACSLRDNKAALADKGYAILGVSKDSAASHQRFIEKQELNFDLIADTDTTLLQALGAWGEKKMCGKTTIGTLRTTYLVNEEGVVTRIFTPKEIKTKEHAEQILAEID
ncbi:MAG: thioredoxin-dependent thiol peroxidase [Bacteroidaceae bacterium]|nr:thioredoxin-dependent thiol peroxidase [Bacteroidaceae bacterium]